MRKLAPLAALLFAGPALGHDRTPATSAPCPSVPELSRHRPAAWPIDPGANGIPGTGDYIAPNRAPRARPGNHVASNRDYPISIKNP